jgi:hypothetical protein
MGSVLGEEHPLSRMADTAHALARQAASTATMLAIGVLAVADHRDWGIPMLCAAGLVELAALSGYILARHAQRDHVLRLIACGRSELPLPEVSREVRRIASPQHASQLARRLQRAFDEARRWHELTRSSRPPHGIRALGAHESDVDAILRQLRSGDAATPGVALLELMLCGSDESALYAGDKDALAEQLRRIRHLLNCPTVEASPRGGS